MSKERARRRAEREAAAAALAAQRAAEAERARRRTARREALTGWLPRPGGGATGLLAERKRNQRLGILALLVLLNLLVFALARDPALTALMLVASVLGGPIVYLMLSRRTTP